MSLREPVTWTLSSKVFLDFSTAKLISILSSRALILQWDSRPATQKKK